VPIYAHFWRAILTLKVGELGDLVSGVRPDVLQDYKSLFYSFIYTTNAVQYTHAKYNDKKES